MLATIPQSKDEVAIERILRRAHEIHRQHGGLFGYDFEDWAQAWSELPERNSRTELGLADEMNAAELAIDTREVFESCFRFTE